MLAGRGAGGLRGPRAPAHQRHHHEPRRSAGLRARRSPTPRTPAATWATPPAFAAQQRAAYPDLAPIALALPAGEALERARRAAEALGWEMAEVRPPQNEGGDGVLEARQVSGLFRFVDDVVVRVRPAANGSVVDVRSKSRDGKGDIGVNASASAPSGTPWRGGRSDSVRRERIVLSPSGRTSVRLSGLVAGFLALARRDADLRRPAPEGKPGRRARHPRERAFPLHGPRRGECRSAAGFRRGRPRPPSPGLAVDFQKWDVLPAFAQAPWGRYVYSYHVPFGKAASRASVLQLHLQERR